ncbi:MAG: DNA repair protein RecO [Armatimonadetes bacterium]|nr:DNA repair protein RecO [Armatimonadota bacterium]
MSQTTLTGIVLRRTDSGESDRRLTVLTFEIGKVDLIAKGARKAGSRLAGVSEPLVLAQFHVAAGKHRRFVTQAQAATGHPALRRDYDRLTAALATVELVAELLPYEAESQEVFETLKTALACLEAADRWQPALAWFLSRVLAMEGQMPDWQVCATSDRQLSGDEISVSPVAGGAIAPNLAAQTPDCFTVDRKSLIGIERIAELEVPPGNLRRSSECITVLFEFWRAALDRRLPTLRTVVEGLAVDDE